MRKLIVIEGVSDGVGKSTQVKELYDKLVKDGYNVTYHHFPSYKEKGATLVEAYLKGELGEREELSPYVVSSFFAMDRFYAFNKDLKDKEGIILLDRYTSSNLIYQGALLKDEEKNEFFRYICDYEYNKLGLKEPDLVIFLKVDKEKALELLEKRNDKDKDINEQDLEYLDKVYDNSIVVASKYNFKIIECCEGGNLRSIEDISQEVYKVVKKFLINNKK
ncbi:MAG TPA: deoxynucleoside kinase [Candidatus Onthousia faecavium]|nr:deoxynucleoside kinase [Candidatus Onthousia faecavium]